MFDALAALISSCCLRREYNGGAHRLVVGLKKGTKGFRICIGLLLSFWRAGKTLLISRARNLDTSLGMLELAADMPAGTKAGLGNFE